MYEPKDRRVIMLGFAAGVCAATGVAVLMGQGQQPPANPNNPPNQPSPQRPVQPTQPAQPGTTQPGTTQPGTPDPGSMSMGQEFFVTGSDSSASLWIRDGTTLRWLSDAKRGARTPDTTNPNSPRRP